MNLTNDKEMPVVTAAAGALRNLTLAVPDEFIQPIVDAILQFNGVLPLLSRLDQVCNRCGLKRLLCALTVQLAFAGSNYE